MGIERLPDFFKRVVTQGLGAEIDGGRTATTETNKTEQISPTGANVTTRDTGAPNFLLGITQDQILRTTLIVVAGIGALALFKRFR